MTTMEKGSYPVDYRTLDSRSFDGSHLTARQAAYIEKYAREVLRALRLDAWEVWVGVDLPPEGALLMIEPVRGRRCATLYVSKNWWKTQSADEKRCDITHEMLHLAHHDVDVRMLRFLDAHDMQETLRDSMIEDVRLDLERMVDALSYAVAPHMPRWRGDVK